MMKHPHLNLSRFRKHVLHPPSNVSKYFVNPTEPEKEEVTKENAKKHAKAPGKKNSKGNRLSMVFKKKAISDKEAKELAKESEAK